MKGMTTHSVASSEKQQWHGSTFGCLHIFMVATSVRTSSMPEPTFSNSRIFTATIVSFGMHRALYTLANAPCAQHSHTHSSSCATTIQQLHAMCAW